MKKSFIIFFTILLVGLISCSPFNNKNKEDLANPFSQFLKKFKMLNLPVVLKSSLGAKNMDYSQPNNNSPSNEDLMKLPEFNKNSIDTLFIKNINEQPLYYGMLPDTANYYGLIFFLKGVEGIPAVLRTFDKSGKQISEENLYCGACMAMLNLEWCSSTGIINNDLTISCIDTIKTVNLDSSSKVIDSTGEFYIIHKEGKIDAKGKIAISREKRKDIIPKSR